MNLNNIRSVPIELSKSNLIACLDPFLRSIKVVLPKEELSDIHLRVPDCLETTGIPLTLNIRKEVQEHKEG